MTHFDRLNPLDRSFLLLESPVNHMHIGGASTFLTGPLRTAAGGVDIDRIRAFVDARLGHIPRYRQRIVTTPLGHPLWVDDAHFHIDYHVRHTALPQPGDEAQLKRLMGRVMSQALDRDKPLWELWIVEGLDGGERFAMIGKVHHAMVDGVSSVDLLTVLLAGEPEPTFTPGPPWTPRAAPTAADLAHEDRTRLLGAPRELLERAPALLHQAREAGSDMRAAVKGLFDLARQAIVRPSETPLNKPIGPHRRFDWLAMDLAEVKRIRRGLGGSVNDVVLTIVTGAVQRFLAHRGVEPAGIDFRVMTPVSVRSEGERGTLGNRVSAWMVPLPLAEPDPRARLRAIEQRTSRLKEERTALGAELLTQASAWTPSTLLSASARLMWRTLPFNMVVTNVPGPQFPLYLLGARMENNFGAVPLTDYLGLGVVLFSYAGTLCWGFTADWDLVPDLDRFVQGVKDAADELKVAAG